MFSGLVALDTDLRLVPDLAESWEISPDGTVYTFKIRPDATFHDGKAVTAHDFKWSIERAADPRTASPVADIYLNDIVGVEDVLEGRAMEIGGIQVIDDRTIQFTIDSPKAYFLAKLTYPTAYVLDRENVEAGGSTWTDTPNGTGPFRLKEYRIGERIVLERFESYTRGQPGVSTILMNLAGGQNMAMYENDEIDFTGVGLYDLERVLDPSEPLNRELVVAPPDFSISYIGFNAQMAPFDDANFRKALNHAIDKELIATEVLSELLTPAYGILPPGFPGYNPELQGLTFDPELAKQLLAQSDYADPATRPRIVVTVPGRGGTIGLDLESSSRCGSRCSASRWRSSRSSGPHTLRTSTSRNTRPTPGSAGRPTTRIHRTFSTSCSHRERAEPWRFLGPGNRRGARGGQGGA